MYVNIYVYIYIHASTRVAFSSLKMSPRETDPGCSSWAFLKSINASPRVRVEIIVRVREGLKLINASLRVRVRVAVTVGVRVGLKSINASW